MAMTGLTDWHALGHPQQPPYQQESWVQLPAVPMRSRESHRNGDVVMLSPSPDASFLACRPAFGSSTDQRHGPGNEHSLRRKTPYGTINGAFQSSLSQPTTKYGSPHDASSRPSLPQPYHPPSYDSMTFSSTRYPLQFVDPLAQNAATVIQLPNQPYGPTASGAGGQGPYGPYCHDGTFVPYTPHAIRDPRYQHQLIDPRAYSSQVRVDPTYFAADSQRLHLQAQHEMLSHPSPHPSLRAGPPATTDMHFSPLTVSQQSKESFPSFGRGQDRQRTFRHGLTAYRDLLASLARSRRRSQQIGTGQPQHRPKIYPKPPSSPDAASSSWTEISNDHARPRFQGSASGDHDSTDSHLYGPDRGSFSCSRDRGYTLDHSTSGHQQPRQLAWPYLQVHVDLGQGLPPRSPGHQSMALMGPDAQQASHLRATDALKLLEELCQQSHWQWIDGLNLSGCLAYALNDYHKASALYRRVLGLEPSHVEATANLAATLLALGRRQEAEEHWLQAVHQAPNYFEAVEHLVGLLCVDGRNKDAIKVISHIQDKLRLPRRSSVSEVSDKFAQVGAFCEDGRHDQHARGDNRRDSGQSEPGFGSSGYAISGADNGRMLALVHAKGNLMYTGGDNSGAASAFEDVILIAAGRQFESIGAVVNKVLDVIRSGIIPDGHSRSSAPVLLYPEQTIQVAQLCFPEKGQLPGFSWLPSSNDNSAIKGALLTTSNALLSLAKILQDGMTSVARRHEVPQLVSGVREILALYYLSLSIHPSPSTANNVGILLAGVQHNAPSTNDSLQKPSIMGSKIPGAAPGSGVALALAYYNYGLRLDSKHAHLYCNLGSLLKDIGQLDAAIEMYKRAVFCDGRFDIALANLANAVKDKGRINDAIYYYTRAVEVSPQFSEASVGLANALNAVCSWSGRGGAASYLRSRDKWHVDKDGMLHDALATRSPSSGWMGRVVDIVQKQLHEGEDWGVGCLNPDIIDSLVGAILVDAKEKPYTEILEMSDRAILQRWRGHAREGARVLCLVERIIRRNMWRWYKDRHILKRETNDASYRRPQLPDGLVIPTAPTVLPFHTFTIPLSPDQIRIISQRNAYRISAATLKSPWLPATVYPPPEPPEPMLKVGYVSSDFNNHPLAHLMQSAFGFHDTGRVEAHCYATTSSDNSTHRKQIETESPHFVDVSTWSNEQLISKIIADGIHILVNLNGYTRGARNEIFAARPAPLQMSFMGFAGTMGAEWCDYLLADRTSIPPSTLRPWARDNKLDDVWGDTAHDDNGDGSDRVYTENIIYCRSTFFCCDHRQSAPDARSPRLGWPEEEASRWAMRGQLFPDLRPDAVIFANFNQLYKIEPTTFRSWLRILAGVPNAVLWLLRFPDLGQANLLATARKWAGAEVAERILFTDVAAKNMHIARAKIVDLFLDTPECNAHTTAADVLWSGAPLLTFPRYEYKMCSRMGASILRGALPGDGEVRTDAERDLIATSQEEYERLAIRLGKDLKYPKSEAEGGLGRGKGRLVELRRMLTEARWTSDLFDTRRWVADLEDGYEEAWRRWVQGRGGDIHLEELPKGRIRPLPKGRIRPLPKGRIRPLP